MTANYKLSKNHFSSDNEDYHAIVEHVETLTEEDILKEMEWHSSSLTKADMVSFAESQGSTIIRELAKGKQVTTDLVHFKLSIKGTFTGPEDQFDPSRHRIVVSLSPGPALRREMAQMVIPLEKQRATKPRPGVDIYINMHNGDLNTTLSPNHTARILGDQLRFDPADPAQGLFLVPQANVSGPLPDPDPIRVTEISRMTGGEIIFLVPGSLTPGEYKLEVRARFGQNDIRTGAFEELLTVA